MLALIKKLLNHNIDFQCYVLLYSLYINDKSIVVMYNDVEPYTGSMGIQQMIHLGYISRREIKESSNTWQDFLQDNLKLTDLGISTFFKDSDSSTPSNETLTNNYKVAWIEEWYNLFPKGVKSGGYYIRTSIKDCDKKMFKFLNDNSGFTKNIILEATKHYITDMSRQNYSMMKLAPNFIYKDGVSMLSGACEAYVEAINNNQDTYSNEDSNVLGV